MLRKIRSLVSNSDYFGIYDNALSKKECEILINQFEKSSHVKGVTASGHNPKLKNCLEKGYNFKDESVVSNILRPVLIKCIGKYADKYSSSLDKIADWKYTDSYNFQKYENEDDGYFSWHCEQAGKDPASRRILAWMFYVNDAKSGTEFMYYPTIRARMGRCVIWPSSWTHVHKGVTPNKGLKYITTGWISYYDSNFS